MKIGNMKHIWGLHSTTLRNTLPTYLKLSSKTEETPKPLDYIFNLAIAPPIPNPHFKTKFIFQFFNMEIKSEVEESIVSASDLDVNGFPINKFESESEPISEESSFASDFYKSGTNWSVLSKNGKNGENLVQKNLFEMWGMKRQKKESEDKGLKKQKDLFEIWGIEKTKERSKSNSMVLKERNGSRNGSENGVEKIRTCPFYKKMPGTPFTVDAFRYGSVKGCTAYFLSHFHYDHYGGLRKNWSHGPIYCTPLTARLVQMCLGVDSLYICPLELNTECAIDGINVMMLEANHCPGAALIHFRLSDGRTYLHTGDFRACELMQSYPALLKYHVNVLYLDTTYCNPKHQFPAKEDVVDFVVCTTQNFLAKKPNTLIVVGAYSIGKEQVYLAVSKALDLPIYTNASRRRILQSYNWPELSGKICSSGEDSSLHVLPISFLRHQNLEDYMKNLKQNYNAVLAFRPTGWTYSEKTGSQLNLIKPNCKGNVTIYGVPYSEHSSFTDLKTFVKFLRPDKIIPTVNVGNAANRDKMQSYFRDWLKNTTSS